MCKTMARNKKYRTGQTAIRFGPAVKALVLCLFIGGSGIGYVAEKHEIYQLGQQITKREAVLSKMEDTNEKLKKQLGYMRSPQYLEKKIKEFNLGLVVPQQSQVWRLTEPASQAGEQRVQLAAREQK